MTDDFPDKGLSGVQGVYVNDRKRKTEK